MVSLGNLKIKLPHRGAANGEVLVALRPEALSLETSPPRAPHLSGAVRKMAYLGDRMEYTVETAIGELFVIDSAVARPVPVGATVYLIPARHGIAVVPK